MRTVAAILASAALGALAQSPAGFTSTAPLVLGAGDSLQRVVLPFEAYRDARADLADVRVLNGRGDAVPMAFAGEAQVQRSDPAPAPLPIFPVTSLEPAAGGAGHISIRAADGTLIDVRGGRGEGGKREAIVAYLVDATKLRDPVRALQFDWTAEPGTQVVNVRVEASEDLRTWTPVASSPLVKLEHGGQALGQPRVEFAARKAKYYRVTWSGPPFELRSLGALAEERVQPPPREVRPVRGAAGDRPGEFVFDAGARLPVEALRVLPQEENGVMAVEILARDDERKPWRPVTRATFYRLVRDGVRIDSPPLELRHAARYWLLRTEAGSGAGIAPPTLELHWRPAQVVFVARGDPPFTLAFGQADAKPAVLPVSSLIPGYERWAELRLPEARVAEVRTLRREPPFWKRFGIDAEPKQAALWAVLVGGVLLLAFMAWRLHGQMQAAGGERKAE